ncbi:Rv1733c family protein [Nocardia arizonensis]|uniref:Rv1733c family protein n=1 Tax=Nocardia arizonensis TaxID=1141647 RepID=UPI0006CF49B0|nr:hypothetical protein [Nocardia arizonensis]
MTTGSIDIVRRTCRRVGLDRNPMRRGEDRWQTGIAVLLAVVVLAAVPLVILFVGLPVHAAETRAVQTQTARLHKVDATVTEVGQAPLYAPIIPVKLTWRDADGTVHTGDYHSDIVVKVGATLPIWLDSADRVVEPPASDRALSRAVLTCLAVHGAVLIACVGSYLALRGGLDRRRARLWETEWAKVGLTWGGSAN